MSTSASVLRLTLSGVIAFVLLSALGLGAATPILGQDVTPQPRPNGALLLDVAFADGTGGFVPEYDEEWMTFSAEGGLARIVIPSPDLLMSAVYAGARYGDLAAEVDMRAVTPREDGDIGLVLRGDATQDMQRFYAVTIDPVLAVAYLDLWQEESEWSYLAEAEIPDGVMASKGFNRLRVEAVGDEFTVFLNGVFLLRVRDDTLRAPGYMGLTLSSTVEQGDGETAIGEYDNVRVYALAAPPASDDDGNAESNKPGGDGKNPTGIVAEVTAATLNVRSGPVASYPRLGAVKQGDRLPVLGRNEGCTWVEVETPFGEGWVSAGYVRLDAPCSEAPVTNTPSTPPATTAPTVAATATPVPPSAVLADFEVFGTWRRGDESWGDFTRSGEEVYRGNYAGKLTYDFPANAPGDRNYIVFRRTLPIAGKPSALEMEVFGDGSGNFLNVWVQDAQQQLWQFSFGQIDHLGWETMRAPLDPSLDWPVQPIDGSSETLSYPLQFYALILDYPSDEAAEGVIYVDELRAGQ